PPNVQQSTASITVADAATVASLLVTAGKVLASKGDLVPFLATIGVPRSALPLPSPVLILGSTAGLRIGEVRVTASDGTVTLSKPEERNGGLVLKLPPIPAGATVSAAIRARVNDRARLGTEVLSAQLSQDADRLVGAQARVRIIAEPEFDLGTLLGDVYSDENGNGMRDRGERGLEGVTVVMDDGLQAVTDAEGRYHLAAILPGDRAVKVATHTLPPGSRLTTDDTRIVYVSPGLLVKIDHGVRVPAVEAPLSRPASPSTVLPELATADAGGLRYRLTGQAVPGARVLVAGKEAKVDKKSGAWMTDVTLRRGRTRLAVVTAWPDGRVVLAGRDVFWVERAEGGSLIVPRDEEPRMTLRFPAAALAEPTFTLEGAVTAPLSSLTIAGQPLSPDAKGKVVLKLRVPEAGAGIAVDARFSDGLKVTFDHLLSAGGDFMLLVGLAEGKLGYVLSDGAAGGKAGLYAQGRVKLYAKGRIKGRWLLEGGLDLDSAQLDSWRDLFRGDPQRVFRNIDPDRFYTVYGDASQTTAPAQSRARLFVRIQLDRSELVFGNVQTGLTGVELGRYSRAVTGGRFSFVRASADDPDGPPSTQVILFGAWLMTSRAHDELRGSGGSLYYLSHKNVVEGSEQVRVELRDRVSDRPMTNAQQRATIDYEVDYLAGRVMLREPLSSVAANPTLVRSGNLDGDKAFLVVDYEYIVDGDIDDGVVGARATQKLGPVRLGGTVVNEFRAHGGYTLVGGDLHIDLKKWGSIIGEYAHSYGSLTSFARSDDGGLSYRNAEGTGQATNNKREGNAWKAEADLHGYGVHLHPYARGIDQGYADTAHAQDAGYIQWGIDGEASFWKLKLKVHYDERRIEQGSFDAAGAPIVDMPGPLGKQIFLRQTRRDVGGELGGTFGRVGVRVGVRSERLEDADVTRAGGRTALGARVDVRVVPRLTLYGAGQYAVEKGGGQGLLALDNSLGAIGFIADLGWDTKLTAEGSYGAQGAGGLLSLRSELGPGRIIYGTVTLSQDRDDRLASTVAAGGRERIADKKGNARAVLFAEDQFRDGLVATAGAAGRAHILATGVDVPISKRLLFGATFERGTVSPSGAPFIGAPPVERIAGTIHASYGGERLRLQARGELREDQTPIPSGGTRAALQWLVSGMVTWRAHRDLTLRGKAFFSRSSDSAATLARSTEATVGFAWRPSFTDRIALLGRYTFLDEFSPSPQALSGPVDPTTGRPLELRERAHVASLAADGRLFWRFSLGEKIAAKLREEPTLGTSSLFILWVNRLSLHVTRRWDVVAEYRLLTVPGTSITHGVSLEANVIVVGHLRLGAGWNFADFSDNELTLGRGSEKGFFIRAQGFY
ncbi:MAG TPA: SdrD B-like domain-containing protein, partial [Kofleriaceae bacterium]|nr:SdrD B-like domain-containing protein [Kofleriaceae bacterium]